MPNLSTNLKKKSLSRTHGNIEDKNKVLESSIIIVNCHIIIRNLYNEWIVSLLCYTSSECLPEENVEEENLTLNGGCYKLLFEKKAVNRFAQCHLFAKSPPGRRPNDKYPSTIRTTPDLCKNVSLECHLVATVMHVQSVRSQKCVFLHTFASVSHRPISLLVS